MAKNGKESAAADRQTQTGQGVDVDAIKRRRRSSRYPPEILGDILRGSYRDPSDITIVT